MFKTKPKLLISLIVLIIAVLMLTAASVAWFTVSTNPEISGMQVNLAVPDRLLISADGEHWTENLDLSEQFKYFAPLKPVSTVDGLHWFLPEYNNDGSLKNVNSFELDESLTYANTLIYRKGDDGKWNKLNGNEYMEANNNGYYVYGDFYLKTEEEATEVRLTFPNPYAQANTELKETDGTYVLPAYELVKKEDEPEETPEANEPDIEPTEAPVESSSPEDDGYILRDVSNRAERSVRIGLLINPDYSGEDFNLSKSKDVRGVSDYSVNQYFIYEPNAENRTSVEKPITEFDMPSQTDRYIIDYDYSGTGDDFKESYYYETLPVMKTSEVDTTDSDGTDKKYKYSQTRINPDYLIPQMHCEWNINSLRQTMKDYLTGTGNRWWTSNNVEYPYGSFLNAASLYNGVIVGTKEYEHLIPKTEFITREGKTIQGLGTGEGIQLVRDNRTEPYRADPNFASSQILITLLKEKPVMVRMFVYIEGQDIDCWNDIAAGGFVVNLEFGGYFHESSEE